MKDRYCLLFFLLIISVFVAYGQEADEENGPDTRPMVFIDAKAIENKSDNENKNKGE